MKFKLLSKSLKSIMVLVVFLPALFLGCNASKTAKGAAIGAGAGGAVGAIIGKAAGNTAVGAIIGASVGGTAGALIGRKMDKQAAELREDLKGAEIERVGEGIKITFDSGLMFAINSSDLNGTTKTNLADLAETLNKYEDTNILIEGHTDNTGSDAYNQTLSEKRANSVSNYLSTMGVKQPRLSTIGYGENQPISENETEVGREKNRRVEVAIYANEKMKKAAKRGDL